MTTVNRQPSTVNPRAQRALVTGGAGFIGSHLSDHLLQAGFAVMAIDDLSTGNYENIKHLSDNPNFSLAIETIRNENVVDRLVSECDVIYHLAAAVGVELIVRDPVHTIETNVLGTHVMLKAANRYRKKIVIASTSEIYGKGVNESFGEDDDRWMGPVTRSRWNYACSKTLDEFLALAYHKQKQLPVVIARLFNTVGPRQTGHYGMVVPRLVQQALRNEPVTVYGDGTQSRCFCHVGDVVEGLLMLAAHPDASGQIYNLGTTEEVTIHQLAQRIIELTGSQSKIIFIPYDEAYEEGFEDMHRRKPNIQKVKTLGWKPTRTLSETLRSVIEHTRGQASGKVDG